MKSLVDVLREDESINGIGSGLRKLDHALKGHRGFLPGHLYDISSVMGVHGVGHFDIVMTVIEGFLSRDEREVLFVHSFNKIPWFKMKNIAARRRVKVVKVNSMNEIIVLFKATELVSRFGLIVVEPFSYFYQRNLDLLRRPLLSSENLNPITKYQQSIKCLLESFMSLCKSHKIIMFTMGQMDVYNQRINTGDTDEFFNQRILVPMISLKSQISNYYTNRILLFRDWVIEDGEKLDHQSFKQLSNGKIECLPNFLCIEPRVHAKRTTGWFGVDNKFRLLDLDDSFLLEKAAMDHSYRFGLVNEVVESQS